MSMVPCPRCGSQLAAGARFCMNCGAPAVAQAGVPSAPGQAAAPLIMPKPNSNAGVWWALGIVFLIGAVVFGLGAAGMLRLRGSDPNAVLQKPGDETKSMLALRGDENKSILPVQASPDKSILQRTVEDPLVMPDDVRAWLEHLARIEKLKQELQQDQLDDLMISMRQIDNLVLGKAVEDLTDPDAVGDPKAGVNDFIPVAKMSADWKELRRKFNEDGPPCPAECTPLKNAYDGALAQVPGTLSDINAIAGDLFDPDKKSKIKDLRDVQKNHKDFIDKPLRESDHMVDQICTRYNTKKWFDIKVDSGGGLLGIPGF